MTHLITKMTTALSSAVLFASAVVLTGLGFAVVGTLAVFALLAVGVALLAAPFVAMSQPAADDVVDAKVAA